MILLQAAADDFFTLSTLGTLAGATGIVYVVSGGIQSAFNYNPKWLALIISLLVSFAGVLLLTQFTPDPNQKVKQYSMAAKITIAFFNGFLIYASATGANQILGKSANNQTPVVAVPPLKQAAHINKPKRKFLSRWFDN